jgi:hypothetical protein
MTITKAAVVCRVRLTLEVFNSERYTILIITTTFPFHFRGAGS